MAHKPAAVTRAANMAAEFAARRLGFESTEVHNSDSLDFHEVNIAALLDEIKTAYLAGYAAGKEG